MNLLNKQTITIPKPVLMASTKNIENADYRLVHLGIGNFHRAHQALYTELANEIDSAHWSITGVSFNSARVRDALAKQDYLYTLHEKDTNGESSRLISCVEKVLVAPEDPTAVINCIADAKTQVVSLTVTEKGYCQKSGHLDAEHPGIKRELQGAPVTTMPGYLFESLKQRKALGSGELTIISCDNLPGNGQVLKNVINEYCDLREPEFKTWIAENVSFCSTMVDRIVPATTTELINTVTEKLGLLDQAAVLCEPFKQWVIEDNFITPVPAWHKVGVTITNDVESFEKLKLRILNGCHSLIAYSGLLLGDQYIHETIARPEIKAFVRSLMLDEMGSSLDVPDQIDAEEYCTLIISRFENKYVPYLNSQVATDGTLKLPQRIISPILDLLSRGKSPILAPMVLAIWAVAMQSTAANEDDPVKDPSLSILKEIYKDCEPDELIEALLLVVLPEGLEKDKKLWIIQSVNEHFNALKHDGLLSVMKVIA